MPGGDIEAACRLVVQVDQRDQHQQRAQQRVQEKLERSIDLVRPTPDTDDEIHRNQRGFEEHIEQHSIESRKNTDHQARQNQEGPHVLVHPHRDRLPGGNHHDDGNERRQGHKPERNAIYTKVVEDVETFDPGGFLNKLHRCSAELETLIERQGHCKPRQSTNQGQPTHGPRMLVAAKSQQQRAERDGRPDSKTQQTHFCSSPTC